jgi:hypothetical protein
MNGKASASTSTLSFPLKLSPFFFTTAVDGCAEEEEEEEDANPCTTATLEEEEEEEDFLRHVLPGITNWGFEGAKILTAAGHEKTPPSSSLGNNSEEDLRQNMVQSRCERECAEQN